MKITHIHIERFRGFQNEDFEVGSQLTAIAGQNGTQKSTLLAIVTQTFTLKAEDPMRAEKPLCGGSYISAFKDKFRLSPTFDRPKGHEWTISFDAGVDDFTVESIKYWRPQCAILEERSKARRRWISLFSHNLFKFKAASPYGRGSQNYN